MTKGYYKRLGDYIEQVNVRNRDLSVRNLMGVSIEKRFIKSIANTIGTDLSPYKIVKPRQFAYGPVTSRNGEKITIALYEGTEDCIISQAYESFQITDENELLPEYLMMWAKRPEFDRYARYMSHGSVREIFSWEEMCNVMLPVPPISEQRRIVNEYQTVERRIANNEALIQKLEETAQAIYHHTFVEGIDEENLPEGWRVGNIDDIGDIVGGATPSTEVKEYWTTDGYPWLSPADMPRGVMYIDSTVKHITQKGYDSASTKILPIGSVLFSSRAPIGLTAITGIELCTNQGYKSVIPKTEIGSYFVYHLLMNEKDQIAGQQEGSTFAEISGKELASYEIVIPPIDAIKQFSSKVEHLAKYRHNIEKETRHLRTLLTLLTSKLS